MRILYLSQYFPPEIGATQIRAHELARNWVRLGHSVTMLAEVPNHPSGIVPDKYRGRLYERSRLDGIDVIRVWVRASQEKSFRNRMLFYISYMVSASIAGLLLARGHYDLVYASSPPLFVGAAALILSLVRRLPLVFEVRDLWPESAVSLGELSSPKAISLATRLEEACYNHARLIVVVTQGIMENIIRRGHPPSKITCVPNGANIDLFKFSEDGRSRIRKSLGIEGKLVAIYAGNYGIAYDLEAVIESARLLTHEHDIHIIMVGDGPRKAAIESHAERYNLPNLTMLPEQQPHDLVDYLSAADVALIPLKDLELFASTLPVKMFDSWSCERPVILNVGGEARKVMDQAGGGVYIPPGDPQALADALQKLKSSPEKIREMGVNGRAYTAEYYSRRELAESLAETLEKLIL